MIEEKKLTFSKLVYVHDSLYILIFINTQLGMGVCVYKGKRIDTPDKWYGI